MSLIDYKILTTQGNIGFYQSCELTHILLLQKGKPDSNLFTLASCEERPFQSRSHTYLTSKLLKVSDSCSIGIQRYWLSLTELTEKFEKLASTAAWEIDGKEMFRLTNSKLIPKQRVQAHEDKRVNRVLKNNFHGGSYLLEFFDESKSQVSFLLDLTATKQLNDIAAKIKNIIPVDLSVARDRIGNLIFQFPITVLRTSTHPLPLRDGEEVVFKWHKKVRTIPDCTIETHATLDKNYMGAAIQQYSKGKSQKLVTGNIDQVNHLKVWRNEPNLLLSVSEGTYIKNFILNSGTTNHEPRTFEVEGRSYNIEVTNYQISGLPSNGDYVTSVNATVYLEEKDRLEQSLAFKQYFKGSSIQALEDIRRLINTHGGSGVSLWDPFLRAKDILKTLFFSEAGGVPLRAIGSTKPVLDEQFKDASDLIKAEQTILDNPNHNNLALNLEFRLQHSHYGWAFHDRFIIFPANSVTSPRVYSLGTSVNSLGKSHHILQEVSHPQRVIDAFEHLWLQLNHGDCIIWKYPRS